MAAQPPQLKMNPPLSYPWAELIGKGTSEMSPGAFSRDGGNQKTMRIICNYGDMLPLCYQILGIYSVDQNNNLSRQVPMVHPEVSWLYASRISNYGGYAFNQKASNEEGTYSEYIYGIITIQFTQPMYTILSDADLDRLYPPVAGARQEYGRYLEFTPQPAEEFFTIDKTTMVFTEGTGGSHPVIGASFNAPFGRPLAKPDIVLTWRNVPQQFAFNSNGYPSNILGGIGCVNDAPFLTFATGTLRMLPPRFAPKASPIDPTVNGQTFFFGQQNLEWDITIPFKYFDPPHGATLRGHNLLPFSDGLWWGGAFSGDTTKRIFPNYSFPTIFQKAT